MPPRPADEVGTRRPIQGARIAGARQIIAVDVVDSNWWRGLKHLVDRRLLRRIKAKNRLQYLATEKLT